MNSKSVVPFFVLTLVSSVGLAADCQYDYSSNLHGAELKVVIGEYTGSFTDPFSGITYRWLAIGACYYMNGGGIHFEEICYPETVDSLIINGSSGDDHIEIVEDTFDCVQTGGMPTVAMRDPKYSTGYITGYAGHDTLIGGVESDWIYGGDGSDTVYAGPGDDVVTGDNGCDTLFGEDGVDIVVAAGLFSSTETGCGTYNTVRGGDGNDVLHGSSSIDYVMGEAGDDEIYGFAGNDFVYGGVGADHVEGGDGNDCVAGNNGKTLDETDGDDTLKGNSGTDRFCDASTTDEDSFYNDASEYLWHFISGSDSVTNTYISNSYYACGGFYCPDMSPLDASGNHDGALF